MSASKKIAGLFLALLLYAHAHSQAPAMQEEKEVYLRIFDTFKRNDTIIAVLENANHLGIKKGMFTKAWQSDRAAIPGVSERREFRENGSGKMIILHDTLVIAVIKLYEPKDTLEAGDVVAVKINIPMKEERSVFSELAFYNILFVSRDKKPLYNLRDLVEKDSRKYEDSLYKVILDDIRDTYENAKIRTDLPANITTPVPYGRYKGKTVMEVLRDMTREEMTTFLLYVKTNWSGYTGHKFRLSESFAGWVTTNAPYSYPEIKQALYPVYKNKALLEKQLPKYKKDILNDGVVKTIILDVIKLSNQMRYKEAHELCDFAMVLGHSVKDTLGMPTAYLVEAELYQNQEKYYEAITDCDKAVTAARIAKDKDVEMQAMGKKAFCLYKLARYRESMEQLDRVVERLALYKEATPGWIYNRTFQRVYEYRASVYYKGGEYEKALTYLDTAIGYNNKLNTHDANISNAKHYKFTGEVYSDQGRYSKALEMFQKAKTLYFDMTDKKNEALVENEIAYSYYKLGENTRSLEFARKAYNKLTATEDYNNAGYSMIVTGGCYWSMGKYDSALIFYSEAVDLRRRANNISGQAFAWGKKGELFQLSGMKKDALNAYDSARYYYGIIKDSSGLAEMYNKRGEVYLNDENYMKAATFFEAAKGVTNKTTVEALYNLGMAWDITDTVKARKYYQEALQKSDTAGNTTYEFAAAKSLAQLAYRAHDTVSGHQYYQRCLSLSKELDTKQSVATCLSIKGYYFFKEAKLDSALAYYQQAKDIFDSVDQSAAIWQLISMSDIHMSKGDFAKADEALKRAVRMAANASNNIAQGSALQLSAFLYGLTGEFEKGLNNSDSAILIFLRSGNMLRLGHTFNSRGTLLSNRGEYKDAIHSFFFADSLYKEEQMTEDRGTIANNIGVTYLGQADYSNALKYFQQSLSYLKKGIIDESYLLVQGNIAECLQRLNKNKEAEALILKYLPLARQSNFNRIGSGMAVVMGRVYLALNDLKRSAEYFTNASNYAIESGEKEKLIEALTYLGRINTMEGKKDEAMVNLKKAVVAVDEFKAGIGWESYYELGLLYFNQERFDSAIVYFKKAAGQLDKNTEKLYGGEEAKKIFNNDPRKSDLYNKMTFAYYNSGNIGEAWNYANRGNLAGIKELSGAMTASSDNAEKEKALKKLLALQQTKAGLENTLAKQTGEAKKEILKKIEILETDYNNFLQDVVEQYPELSTYFTRTNADEFNNYKSKLPPDVAVILYLLNDKNLMIFTLTNEKLAVDTMTADLAPMVEAFIASIRDTKKQTGTGSLTERSEPVDEKNVVSAVEFKDISGRLYDTLISPIYDKIKSKKRLCIIPTGIFSNMPFQCLGQNVSVTEFRFLIEDHILFYTNKMSVFNDKNETGGKSDLTSFAAFGVPDDKLRFNITEVKAIGKIIGADSSVYADERATESRAKENLRSKKYIHFATHGVLNYSSDFSQSYLKLLPDKDTSNGNNGQLTMREVQKLGISDCNMVILSACQTAVSVQLVKGWNISPTNSFLISHVRSVMSSLWKVADEPTSILMEYFYNNLMTMDKAEALRQAQIKLSKDPRFVHPNYWGAFVLYGDWR